MELFDRLITESLASLPTDGLKRFPFRAPRWRATERSELVLMRDAAFELGGSGHPSVTCTFLTTTEGLVPEDEVRVIGPDLKELKADTPFARLVFLETEDLGEGEEAYNAIKRLTFVRYNVFPEGYMTRISASSNQERVRVSRTAIQKGLTFEEIGDLYIQKYKENPGVKKVLIVFLTGQEDLKELEATAKKVDDITLTLTKIFDGLDTDCSHCNLKEVCDEVEGLREMHMKQKPQIKKRDNA